MLQVIVRHVEGDQIGEAANSRWQFTNLVLPQAKHRQMSQVSNLIADDAYPIEAQEKRRQRVQLVHDVGDFVQFVVPQVENA